MTDHSDLIRRLVIPMVRERSREPGDAWHQAEQALTSQSLSLSEAREEIERLRQEKRDVLQRANDCVLSMLFMPGIRAALDKLPPDDPVEPYMERLRELEAKEARLAALENGPAAFADATNDPASSDLSSLRKGAEVAVKPLEWVTHDPDCWYARCPVSSKEYYVIREDGRWWATWDLRIPAFDTAEEGKSAAQSDFETRIRSALVSGSREDGR